MEIIAECSVSVNLQNTQYMGSDNRIMNLRVQSGCMATRGLALPQSYYTYLRWDQKNVYRRQPEKDLTVEAGWHLKGVDLCSGGIDLCEEASNAPLPWSTSATLSLFSKRIHFMPGICSALSRLVRSRAVTVVTLGSINGLDCWASLVLQLVVSVREKRKRN